MLTEENLRKRGLLSNTTCIRCGAPESIDHILFHCQYETEVWTYDPWDHPIDITMTIPFFEKLEESWKRTPLPPYGFTGNAFPWFWWFIWISRNQLVFKSQTQSPMGTALKALLSLKEREIAQPPRSRTTIKSGPSHQHQANLNFSEILCNTDGSWSPISGEAGLAWITNGAAEELFYGSSNQSSVSSPCMGEVMVISLLFLGATIDLLIGLPRPVLHPI